MSTDRSPRRHRALLSWILLAGLLLLRGAPVRAQDAAAPATVSGARPPAAAPADSRIVEEKKGGKAGEDEKAAPLTFRWFWDLGEGGDQSHYLPRAMTVALALLLAFLTVVQIWQIPPPSTSLTRPREAAAGAPANDAKKSPALPGSRVGMVFDSNFSRTVLSGLGGLAAVSLVADDKEVEGYYFVLFVLFFLAGLVLSALVRGFGEALRSRIILNRPAVQWRSQKASRLLYWNRRFWNWLTSFRATILVFIDTVFNVLVGKNELRTAVFSETITDLHEALLDAAERTREEVHHAVLRALINARALPEDLPHEERIRVGVSLLAADEPCVYYIAWERGSYPERFDQHSVAWVAAHTGEARWCRSDAYLTPENEKKLDLIYRKSDSAVLFDNSKGRIPGPQTDILLRQYYQPRSSREDYEGFIVLPMPWNSRGRAIGHRRGAIHISFKKASYMEALWENLESWDRYGAHVPNYEEWKGLLEPAGKRSERPLPHLAFLDSGASLGGGQTAEGVLVRREVAVLEQRTWIEETEPPRSKKRRPIAIKDNELGSVLYQALEVLGCALSHFDDEVYDVYVRSRRHAGIPH